MYIALFKYIFYVIKTKLNFPEALDGDVTDVTAKVISGKRPITIGSTTITAVVNTQTTSSTVTLDVGGSEEEDRDEADGDDEDMESNNSSDNVSYIFKIWFPIVMIL